MFKTYGPRMLTDPRWGRPSIAAALVPSAKVNLVGLMDRGTSRALDMFMRDGLLLMLLRCVPHHRDANDAARFLELKRFAVLAETAAEIGTFCIDPAALAALKRGVGVG